MHLYNLPTYEKYIIVLVTSFVHITWKIILQLLNYCVLLNHSTLTNSCFKWREYVCARTHERVTHTHTQLFYWTVLVLQIETVNKEYIFLRKVNKEYIPIYPKTHRLLCLLNHLSSRSSFPFPEKVQIYKRSAW